MYSVMKAVYDSGIPISFKGSMVLKACLFEAGFLDETRHTVDIDANWNTDTPPTAEQMVESLQRAINRGGMDYEVRLYRMYGEKRSAGFELVDRNTDEILFTMDVDVNRPITPTQIYEVDGICFRGVSPLQMIADKVAVVSTDKVFRRIKDVVDLYYISKVFEFDVQKIYSTLKCSERTMGDFQGFLQRKEDLRHSYDKFRFAGGVNKPPFDAVYREVKIYLKDVLPIPQYARMTMVDEMDFGSLGEKKKAIFCVIPVDDSSMNYLVGMLYTQCFQALYRRADEKHNGRLPVPVRVIQDEWANVAQPESYPKILATCRSYNIGLNIIVQNIQQIKALYEKEWESIIGNCDTLLFLGGGNEPTSLEFIVKLLGKETIATRTRGQTKGRSGSSSTNFQQTGRDLMTIDEVRKLDTHKAILFIRGEDPVLDKKYNIKRHPNIKLTTDGKAKSYIHKPQGAPDYALPDLPYAFRSLDDYEFIDMEDTEHELSEQEKDFKPDKTE